MLKLESVRSEHVNYKFEFIYCGISMMELNAVAQPGVLGVHFSSRKAVITARMWPHSAQS